MHKFILGDRVRVVKDVQHLEGPPLKKGEVYTVEAISGYGIKVNDGSRVNWKPSRFELVLSAEDLTSADYSANPVYGSF